MVTIFILHMSPKERPYDNSRGKNRYVTLPLEQYMNCKNFHGHNICILQYFP